MNITIKDIAKIANVSYATVSRALNGHKDVSQETREKILKICEQIGYSPNAIARGLVTKSTNTIGLLVPDITSPFYPEVALGVEDEARKHGYNIFLCNSNWEMSRTETYFRLLLERRVDGIIIAPVSDETIKLAKRYNDRLPIVFVSSDPKEKSFNYVTVDNLKGGFIATEYLIKLGHRKIAFIGGNASTSSYSDRLEGYKKAFMQYKLDIDYNMIRSGSFTKDCGYEITKQFIKEGILPTAIVCASDVVALGVIEAAEECNLQIPKDISLMGYDDISYASLPKIRLTTVFQPKYELGKAAVDILIQKLEGNCKKAIHKIMQPEVIVRSTCKEI